jgi:CrcB protein
MNILAVGAGGFVGAILRYLVGQWIHITNGFPLETLIVNLFGCLFLAWFFTITTKKWNINLNLKLAIGTGFTGAFTTFSTFSVETLNLINYNQFSLALLYILLSVLGGIGLALTGVKLATIRVQPVGQTEGESE